MTDIDDAVAYLTKICHSTGADFLDLSSYNEYQQVVLMWFELAVVCGEKSEEDQPDVSNIVDEYTAFYASIPFMASVALAVGDDTTPTD